MNKYFLVLCYNKDGQASFLRTRIFFADNEEEGYHIGEARLDEKYPNEVKNGINCWLVSVDELLKEI